MLAQTLFHTLMSNLEELEGSQAFIAIGLPLSWRGHKECVTLTLKDQKQWDDVLDMLLDFCTLKPETDIDPYLTALHSVRVAF